MVCACYYNHLIFRVLQVTVTVFCAVSSHIMSWHCARVPWTVQQPCGTYACSVACSTCGKPWASSISVLKGIKLVFYSLLFPSHHGNAVSSCVYSHHDRYLCTCSWDKCVRVFDIATGTYRWGAGVGGWGPGVRWPKLYLSTSKV